MDEHFSVHSVTKAELINTLLHKLRYKICVKFQGGCKLHTCCSFEMLNFSTTALWKFEPNRKSKWNVFLSPKLCHQHLACYMSPPINETLKQNELLNMLGITEIAFALLCSWKIYQNDKILSGVCRHYRISFIPPLYYLRIIKK